MNIEQKAKAYDEALDRARKVHKYSSDLAEIKRIEDIFPELKDSKEKSEDERIRKNILAFVRHEGQHIDKYKWHKWIAWLEKQGEQKSMKTCAEYYNQDNELKMPKLSKFQNKLADILMYREYDGPDETEDDIAKGRLEYELAAIRLSEELLPLAQEEQKPADKVEPKFKVGDWVSGYYTNYKVMAINSKGYVVEDTDGNKINILFENEKFHHLFTIADAKNGDVLSDGTTIFIFEDLLSDGSVMSYCDYDTDSGESDAFCPLLMNLMCSKITPTTKEQHDTLMKAMADAGYTFDFEKKELKKIEDEEYNGKDYGIDSLFHAQRILEKTLGSVEGYQSDDGILEHKCAISAVKKLYEQKPASITDELIEDY